MPIDLRTHGLALTVDLSPPNADGWMGAHVNAEAPGFTCDYRFLLWRPDLEQFESTLKQMLESVGQAHSCVLSSTEPGLELQLDMDRLGHVAGSYRLQHFNAPGQPALSGDFEMDQTFIRPLLDQVRDALLSAG